VANPDPRPDQTGTFSVLLDGLLQAVAAPVLVIGLDDVILAWNPAAAVMLGSPADSAGRLRFRDLPISYRAGHLRAAIEAVKLGGEGHRLAAQTIRVHTDEVSVAFAVAPVRLGHTLLGVAVTADDQCEVESLRSQLDAVRQELDRAVAQATTTSEALQTANEELRAANGELEEQLLELRDAQEASRHKDEFLAMLAHELRNPLAPILTAAGILEHHADNPAAVRRAGAVVERQARHQARLLDDLLDVSRITRGTIELQRQPLDLHTTVADALESTRPLIEARHHHVTLTPADEPLPVDGDPVRLSQVAVNLLSNAAKYTPPGGRIGVITRREAGRAVLRVTDSGIGIPTHMLDRVFDLFTQVDASLARSQGGLGIGLTLVRQLVELHGGTVTAQSHGPGTGSQFVVSLPLGGAHQDPAISTRPSTGGPQRPWHILIIEDHADAREMLREALTIEGHRVLAAEDGPRGIEMALLHRPEVVVIDIGLPGVSGYEVAARLREALGDGIRLVALSGYGQPDDRRRSRQAGFDTHLVKPIAPEDLERVLAGFGAPGAV
jgi:signal transduction histidine kinase/CheY-like chemotaxis protein